LKGKKKQNNETIFRKYNDDEHDDAYDYATHAPVLPKLTDIKNSLLSPFGNIITKGTFFCSCKEA